MYTVAQHTFMVNTPAGLSVDMLFPSLSPFVNKRESAITNLLFTLTFKAQVAIVKNASLLAEFEWEDAACAIYTADSGEYEVQMFPRGENTPRRMIINNAFTHAVAEFKDNTPTERFMAGNFLMMLYAFATAMHDTLMFHASVIRLNDEGYLFLGKSGTGKSTHSRLWLQHIADARLLNDDNPIVRVHSNGETWVYGSPWSGKTPCYLNEGVPVKGIVRLEQASRNHIQREKNTRAFASLLPSCSCLHQDKRLFDGVCTGVTKLATSIPVYKLECLPDAEAAHLCYLTLTKE